MAPADGVCKRSLPDVFHASDRGADPKTVLTALESDGVEAPLPQPQFAQGVARFLARERRGDQQQGQRASSALV